METASELHSQECHLIPHGPGLPRELAYTEEKRAVQGYEGKEQAVCVRIGQIKLSAAHF